MLNEYAVCMSTMRNFAHSVFETLDDTYYYLHNRGFYNLFLNNNDVGLIYRITTPEQLSGVLHGVYWFTYGCVQCTHEMSFKYNTQKPNAVLYYTPVTEKKPITMMDIITCGLMPTIHFDVLEDAETFVEMNLTI